VQAILFVLNGPAYGTENSYNAFRIARTLLDVPDVQIRVFLIGDAVTCAKKEQKTPNGYYNLAKMILSMTQKGVAVGACGTCMDARGLTDSDLVEGAHRSSMKELAEWTLGSTKVVTF
jgi:uncharacterized protein involved in oxidation of intracellular sulfur